MELRAPTTKEPADEDIVDLDLRVGEQAVHLFGGMPRVQAACGGEALTNGADRERGATQHAEGRVAERGDALGVQILPQHAAKDLPDLIAGEPLLPDDHLRCPSTGCCAAGDLLDRTAVKVVLVNSQGYAAFGAHTILFGIAPIANGFVCVPREMRG